MKLPNVRLVEITVDFFSEDPLVDAKEKLRSYETVGKLRAEVIDDQQIAVENVIIFALGSLRV